MEKRIKIREEIQKGYDTKELLKQVIHFQVLYRPVNLRDIIEKEKVDLRRTLEQVEEEDKVVFTGIAMQKIEELKRGNYIVELDQHDAVIAIPSLKELTGNFLDEVNHKYPDYYDDEYEGRFISKYHKTLDYFVIPHSFSVLFYGFHPDKIKSTMDELSTLYLEGRMPCHFMEFRLLDEENNVTYRDLSEIPSFLSYTKEMDFFSLSTSLDDSSILDSFTEIQTIYVKQDRGKDVQYSLMGVQVRTVHLLHYFATLAQK